MLWGVSEISPGKGCLMPGDYLLSGRVSQPVRSASPATARVQGEARTKPFQPVVSRAIPQDGQKICGFYSLTEPTHQFSF